MENIKRNVMQAIKMTRTELLKIVIENKAKHISEYNEAVEDYKKLVLQISKDNLKYAKEETLESFKKIKSIPTPPVSYEDSYKRAIRMLELSVDEFIEVEEEVFNQLVLDEWSWKRNFTVAAASYKFA